MKTRIFSVISILLVAGAFSCSKDEFTLTGLPKQGPVVASFNVPGVVVPGNPTDLSVVVNGTETNPIGTVILEITKKAETSVVATVTKTPTAGDDTGAVTFTWTDAESSVSDLAPGDYTIHATASNANGKTVGQTFFTVLSLDVVCQQVGMVTVVMHTPQDIPSDLPIGAVGSFAGSGWGTDFIMTPLGNGYYCVALPLANGDEFKFRINASWGTEEKKSDCGGAPNRAGPGGVWPAVTLQEVPKWGGYGC